MKLFMILLNVVSVIILVFLIIDEGVSSLEDMLLPLFLLGVFLANAVSMIALYSDQKSWLGLYFQRKSLEEQRKIDKLSRDL